MVKKVLYLGLNPKRFQSTKEVVHYPIISIERRAFDESLQKKFEQVMNCSLIIMTSQNAAAIFFGFCQKIGIERSFLNKKTYVAVGKATASLLPHAIVAKRECAEGVIDLLEKLTDLQKHSIFYSHSASARPLLAEYLLRKKVFFVEAITYAPKVTTQPLEYDMDLFDEIVFTSPSTVHAFFEKKISLGARQLTTIGPITHNTLLNYVKE